MIFKLLHIHSNITFIHDVNIYKSHALVNEILFLGEETTKVRTRLEDLGFSYKTHSKEGNAIPTILQIIEEYDGVVLNDLSGQKLKLLPQIPKTKKVFVRLFGYELYSLQPKSFRSKQSQKYHYPVALSKPTPINLLKRIKNNYVRNKRNKEQLSLQKEVYKRIDRIILLSGYEHRVLQKYFYMPPMIQRPIPQRPLGFSNEKSNTIILGNSGAFWNNHLDIFPVLKGISLTDVNVKCFFSYATSTAYAKKVKKESQKYSSIELITEFLPKEEFQNIYKMASALVINSYRQHAMGNIFTALALGCKLYLNPKSVIYHWLIDEGFYISKVNDLREDILSKNYKLSIADQQHNVQQYTEYLKAYSEEDFVEEILLSLDDNEKESI